MKDDEKVFKVRPISPDYISAATILEDLINRPEFYRQVINAFEKQATEMAKRLIEFGRITDKFDIESK